LYDVDILNHKPEKQNKIAYECLHGIDYSTLIMFLSAIIDAKQEISLVRIISSCDYNKFRMKQLSCNLIQEYQSPDGTLVSIPTNFMTYFSAYQQQSGIIDAKDMKIKWHNRLSLKLSYLMPETEVTISLYPVSIANK